MINTQISDIMSFDMFNINTLLCLIPHTLTLKVFFVILTKHYFHIILPPQTPLVDVTHVLVLELLRLEGSCPLQSSASSPSGTGVWSPAGSSWALSRVTELAANTLVASSQAMAAT